MKTPQPTRTDLRATVARNLMSLGRHRRGWDRNALAVLRAASQTVATAGLYPIVEQVALALGRTSRVAA